MAPNPVRTMREEAASTLIGQMRTMADTDKVSTRIMRYSEHPELWAGWFADGAGEVWPEYNQHGDELNAYWDRLYEVFPEWQFLLYDTDERVILAEGHTIPLVWDGDDATLGPGIDAMIADAFASRASGDEPTAVSALAAEIPSRYQGRGLARVMLTAMKRLASEAGRTRLIAPVRPSMKDRYPTIPIERYARWTRDDGAPFDPWIRAHIRLGARIGPVIPRSLHIGGTVAEWESWTGMRFPETGDYVFPGGLTTVRIDRDTGTGEYWEPNVWIIHPVSLPGHDRPEEVRPITATAVRVLTAHGVGSARRHPERQIHALHLGQYF